MLLSFEAVAHLRLKVKFCLGQVGASSPLGRGVCNGGVGPVTRTLTYPRA